MRNLSQIGHINLIGNGLSERDGQVHFSLLELLRIENALHRNDVRLFIGYFDTDRSFAGNRGNDSDSKCGKTQSYVIFEIANLVDANAFGRGNLIKGNGWSDSGFDFTNLHTKTIQYLDNTLVITANLFHIHFGFPIVVVLFKKVECREFIAEKRFSWIDWCAQYLFGSECIAACNIFTFGYFYGEMSRLIITCR